MARKLKATYSDSNECEVTGMVSRSTECAETELDSNAVGRKVFPKARINIYENLVIENVTPAEVTIINTSSNERYIVKEGEKYRTGTYTFSGRYNWWFTFEILDC